MKAAAPCKRLIKSEGLASGAAGSILPAPFLPHARALQRPRDVHFHARLLGRPAFLYARQLPRQCNSPSPAAGLPADYRVSSRRHLLTPWTPCANWQPGPFCLQALPSRYFLIDQVIQQRWQEQTLQCNQGKPIPDRICPASVVS